MLFAPEKLSLGIVLPIQPRTIGNGETTDIDFALQLDLAARADAFGFSALWVRDVPLNSPAYPDPIGHSDPWILLGALAATTRRITLATGAIVLPLRHPFHIAKAALSLDALSKGRVLLGLGAGDRPSEFKAFGRSVADRRELFRDNWAALSSALSGDIDGREDFRMRPRSGRDITLVAVGSSSQSLEWIARNASAWMTYHRPLAVQKDRIGLWHGAVGRSTTAFRGLGQVMALELVDTVSDGIEEITLGYRAGPDGLVKILGELRALGVHHVALNLAMDGARAASALAVIAKDVLPRLNDD
jgi:luciferase-type oxidoreductase